MWHISSPSRYSIMQILGILYVLPTFTAYGTNLYYLFR